MWGKFLVFQKLFFPFHEEARQRNASGFNFPPNKRSGLGRLRLRPSVCGRSPYQITSSPNQFFTWSLIHIWGRACTLNERRSVKFPPEEITKLRFRTLVVRSDERLRSKRHLNCYLFTVEIWQILCKYNARENPEAAKRYQKWDVLYLGSKTWPNIVIAISWFESRGQAMI